MIQEIYGKDVMISGKEMSLPAKLLARIAIDIHQLTGEPIKMSCDMLEDVRGLMIQEIDGCYTIQGQLDSVVHDRIAEEVCGDMDEDSEADEDDCDPSYSDSDFDSDCKDTDEARTATAAPGIQRLNPDELKAKYLGLSEVDRKIVDIITNAAFGPMMNICPVCGSKPTATGPMMQCYCGRLSCDLTDDKTITPQVFNSLPFPRV